jgi:hypothetical protein
LPAITKKTSRSAKPPKSSRIDAPGYGFPKDRKGLLEWPWAEQRLKKSHNYWITTITPGKPKSKPHSMVIWGLWQDGRFLFITGAGSRKTRNLEANMNCIVATEDASEAVIVEGVAEIVDVETRRKLIPIYEKKYKYDLSTMKDDLLSMKEPVYAVRPQVVFGLWEKHFQNKSTRWRFH